MYFFNPCSCFFCVFLFSTVQLWSWRNEITCHPTHVYGWGHSIRISTWLGMIHCMWKIHWPLWIVYILHPLLWQHCFSHFNSVIEQKNNEGKWEGKGINRVNSEDREKMEKRVRYISGRRWRRREKREGWECEGEWNRQKQRDRCSSAAALPSEWHWGVQLQLSMTNHFPDRDPFKKQAGNFHLLHVFWADYLSAQRRL